MKKLKMFTTFTVMALFISCSSDDEMIDNNDLNQEDLIGEYKLQSFNKEIVSTFQTDGFETVVTTTQEGGTYGLTYDFTEENTLIKDGNFYVSQIKQRNDEEETMDSTFIKSFHEKEVSYVLDEDHKELTIDGEIYQIRDFSEGKLRLSLLDTIENTEAKRVEVSEDIELAR